MRGRAITIILTDGSYNSRGFPLPSEIRLDAVASQMLRAMLRLWLENSVAEEIDTNPTDHFPPPRASG